MKNIKSGKIREFHMSKSELKIHMKEVSEQILHFIDFLKESDVTREQLDLIHIEIDNMRREAYRK